MLKILMLSPLPPPSGGIASWTVRYKKYCEDKDVNLRIVNIVMRGERASSEVMRRDIKTELIRTIDIIKTLHEELKIETPNVIHVNTSCSPFGVFRDAICVHIACRKAPVILHCRCNIQDQLGTNTIVNKVFQYLVKKSNKVITLNKYSAEFINHIEEKKSIYIPNFIDNSMINNKHAINDAIENVLYVGHIERAKGIDQIVRVASKNPQINFILVGAIRENLSDLNIPNNVLMVGRITQEEVKCYYQKADVFLFPSLSEGFSNALLEAMAMGLPIIATDVGANYQMIESFGGIIIHNNDEMQICEALCKMKDKSVRERMSLWNINKVKMQYTEDIVMNDYFKLYRDVVGGN